VSSHFGVESLLEWLSSLRAAIRDFVAREKQLREDQRQRIELDQKRRETAIASERERLETDLDEEEDSFKQAVADQEARYRARIHRIRTAQRNARKRALDRVEAEEGKRKFELQREMLRAARERESGLATADENFGAIQARLAEQRQGLARLEQQAQLSFSVYGKSFLNLLAGAHEGAEVDLTPAEDRLADQLDDTLKAIETDLKRFDRRFFRRISGLWALWLVVVLSPLPMLPVLHYFGYTSFTAWDALIVTLGIVAIGLALHLLGKYLARPATRRIASLFGRARLLHHAGSEKAVQTHQRARERIEADYQETTTRGNEAWNRTIEIVEAMRESLPGRVDAKATRMLAVNDRKHEAAVAGLRQLHQTRLGQRNESSQARLKAIEHEAAQGERTLLAQHEAAWRRLESEWHQKIGALIETANAAILDPAARVPGWTEPGWEAWTPPADATEAVRFGRAEVDLPTLAGELPADPRLSLPGPRRLSLPLLLHFPEAGSLLLETRKSGRDEAIASLNQVVLRILATSPVGRVAFTMIDPAGLGQGFAGLMHLSDEAGHLINGRVWTQTVQIEERLGELNDHVERVIQMYLRNEYPSIAEYNQQAGTIAERYQFLVIADFPVNFSDIALRRLMNIVTRGPRCGVYTLIHWNLQQTLPPDFDGDDLRKHSVALALQGTRVIPDNRSFPGVEFHLDPAPPADLATVFIQRVARASIDSNRVEVPFEQVAPPDSELWSLETVSELRVPIGRTGATKLQFLAIGKGTRQHALIAGKTGSGKSTLFHVIITNLALWCSPEQVEFYLVDFKKGVEFKCYATHRLPHARVVAIESDREFGLSVLQRVDEELKRRGDLFRQQGVQDLPGFRRAGRAEPLPRVLLLIDEFQELFIEEDRIAQAASLLLDRIVRQGRAFGIHVILGSQTLGGAYTVARSTLGQMVIRIALQCNEADAYLIMDENNAAPRLLSRPGEGIYNDAAGLQEANSAFQVVWLSDDVRDAYLRKVRERADREASAYPGPMVFEGDAPAEVRDNETLDAVLRSGPGAPPSVLRTWLGAPNSIKGPTEVVFDSRSGSNLLLVGQREDAIVAIFSVALVALAAQHPQAAARFIILDASPPESTSRELLERIARGLPHQTELGRPSDLEVTLTRLQDDISRREAADRESPGPATFLFIRGLQDFKKLRQEDEFSLGAEDTPIHPAVQLRTMLSEGPGAGVHVIASCDTYTNVARFLGRKGMGEFAMRVLFQMSANDSASLIDHPGASRLGMHRALLHQEHEGYLELFRPYAVPDNAWIDWALSEIAMGSSHHF
jgi:hypothetical protein